MSERVVWGATSYDCGGNVGYVVSCLFTDEAAAQRYVERPCPSKCGTHKVEELTLYEGDAPAALTYWHYGAEVYPDKTVKRWRQEHFTQPPSEVPPLDDHMNDRSEPWDGHTQEHCGEHVSIFGTDREALESALRRHVDTALARQNGTCQGQHHKHEGDVDGTTVYESGWGSVRRAGTGKDEKLLCYQHFAHDFPEEGGTCRHGYCGTYMTRWSTALVR